MTISELMAAIRFARVSAVAIAFKRIEKDLYIPGEGDFKEAKAAMAREIERERQRIEPAEMELSKALQDAIRYRAIVRICLDADLGAEIADEMEEMVALADKAPEEYTKDDVDLLVDQLISKIG